MNAPAKVELSAFDMIAAAIEKAATPQDQLQLSNCLPLIFNKDTQRYTLAPTAEAVYKLNIENANRPPPKLNFAMSARFAALTVKNQGL
jgi:hypothetical protein